MKLRFGYGTIISLAIVSVLVGTQIYQKRQSAAREPVVEHQVHGITGIAPVPEFALRHRAELALTNKQVHEITALAASYRKEVAPVKIRLDAAASDYTTYMERTVAEQRPEDKDVTERSAEVQRLSAVLASTRHAYWQRVLAVLTPSQVRTAQRAITGATLTDLQ